MGTQKRKAAAILTGAALALVTVAPGTAHQSPTTGQMQIAGAWKINTQLSSPSLGSALGQNQPPAGRGGSTGGRRGGRGGGGFGGGRGGGNPEQALQMRVLMREVTQPPDELTIVVTATQVTFTDGMGVIRRFQTNDKKEKVEFGTAKIDAKTKWDKDVLTFAMTAGQLKVTETYQARAEGSQLVATVKAEGGGRGGSAQPIRRVYDRQ